MHVATVHGDLDAIAAELRARNLAAQQGKAAIAIAALNQMIRVAKPASVGQS